MASFGSSRRRRWLVDRRHQIRFVGLVAALTLVTTAAMTLAAMVYHLRVTGKLLAFIAAQDALPFAGDVEAATRGFLILLGALLLLSTLGVMIYAVRASNRIAGPGRRLSALLLEVANGDSSQRITFRKKDRLAELADALNQKLQARDEEHNRLKAEIPFLVSSLQTCRTDLELGKFPLDADELRRMEATLRALAQSWSERSGDPEPSEITS